MTDKPRRMSDAEIEQTVQRVMEAIHSSTGREAMKTIVGAGAVEVYGRINAAVGPPFVRFMAQEFRDHGDEEGDLGVAIAWFAAWMVSTYAVNERMAAESFALLTNVFTTIGAGLITGFSPIDRAVIDPSAPDTTQ